MMLPSGAGNGSTIYGYTVYEPLSTQYVVKYVGASLNVLHTYSGLHSGKHIESITCSFSNFARLVR